MGKIVRDYAGNLYAKFDGNIGSTIRLSQYGIVSLESTLTLIQLFVRTPDWKVYNSLQRPHAFLRALVLRTQSQAKSRIWTNGKNKR
jgi:hypothetical protein